MPDDQVEDKVVSEEQDSGNEDKSAELEGRVNELTSQLEETTTKLNEASERGDLLDERYVKYLEGLEDDAGKRTSVEAGDGFDPEEATRAQLLTHLKTQRGAEVKALKDEFSGALDDLRKQVVQSRVQDDLERAIEKHPDLDLDDSAYKKHFHSVATENPSWKAEKVYKQVKMERRDKAEEESTANAKKAEAKRNLHTEKGGLSDSVAQHRDMDSKEAFGDAWERTMGNADSIGPG
jgi:hypothetical protein